VNRWLARFPGLMRVALSDKEADESRSFGRADRDLERRLWRERPRPTRQFESRLRRRLSVASRAKSSGAVVVYGLSGALLLAVAALGLAGVGPLG